MGKRAASGGQIRPRRPQIQSRGINRRSLVLRACSTAQTNPSWGSKRARTPLCSLATMFLFARPKALSGLYSWGRRDWASLGGDGPTGVIAELALASDVADYIRFRAACRAWRLCSVDPRSQSALDGRFLPRQWIMLDNAHCGPRRRRFLNLSTGECIRTDLPELAEHTLLALSPEGLLLLIHESTLVVRLLNPLTRQLTELPPVTALLTPELERDRLSGEALRDIIRVCGVGLADDASTVAVCFRHPNVIVIAKPGDKDWTVVDHSCRYIDSALPFAGRFYCAVNSSVMVLSSSVSDQGARPRLLTAVQRSTPLNFCRMSGSLHLVDNGGELMLVHRMLRPNEDTQAAKYRKTRAGKYKIAPASKYRMEYEVYRVDFDAGDLVPVKDLGGRAVFMGGRRAVSVLPAAGAFPSVSADTLYLGFDCAEKTIKNRIDGYNVADGSSEPSHHNSISDVVHPCSLVDCLSYCIQGTGKHLA